jgi:hypothetical protein
MRKRARTDLCGGRPSNRRPYRDIRTVAGFNLMDVREIWRRLKTRIELKSPSKRNRVTVETFEIIRRWAVRLDFVPLSIEINAPIVIRRHVHVKHKDIIPKVCIKGLRDMRAKLRVITVGHFGRVAPEHGVKHAYASV